MAISSRAELIEYCLTKLGKPVIEINVAESQLNDRIDEALQYFNEYHSEALQKTYIKYKVTASHLQLTTNVAPGFQVGETVEGNVSKATMVVYDRPELNKIRSRALVGDFIIGETITGLNSGATATIAPVGIFIGDTQNKYLALNDLITNVTHVYPFTQTTDSTNNYMFDVRYQLHLNDIFNMNTANIQYYTQVHQYMSLLNFTLNVEPTYSFSRLTHKLTLNIKWDTEIRPDQIVVAQGYTTLDPNGITMLYNDMFIKRYAYALIKKQWASNLSKYQDLELPGGVKLNAKFLYDEATAELEKLESQMTSKFSSPLGFLIG